MKPVPGYTFTVIVNAVSTHEKDTCKLSTSITSQQLYGIKIFSGKGTIHTFLTVGKLTK